MTVLKIEGAQVFMSLGNGMEIWVPKAMLRQYGITAKMLKVGAVFPV